MPLSPHPQLPLRKHCGVSCFRPCPYWPRRRPLFPAQASVRAVIQQIAFSLSAFQYDGNLKTLTSLVRFSGFSGCAQHNRVESPRMEGGGYVAPVQPSRVRGKPTPRCSLQKPALPILGGSPLQGIAEGQRAFTSHLCPGTSWQCAALECVCVGGGRAAGQLHSPACLGARVLPHLESLAEGRASQGPLLGSKPAARLTC